MLTATSSVMCPSSTNFLRNFRLDLFMFVRVNVERAVGMIPTALLVLLFAVVNYHVSFCPFSVLA